MNKKIERVNPLDEEVAIAKVYQKRYPYGDYDNAKKNQSYGYIESKAWYKTKQQKDNK